MNRAYDSTGDALVAHPPRRRRGAAITLPRAERPPHETGRPALTPV